MPFRSLITAILIWLTLFCATTVFAQSSSENGTATTSVSYQVQSGDTLYGIAANNGITFDVLAAFNGIANPHSILPGLVIQIPVANNAGIEQAAREPQADTVSSSDPENTNTYVIQSGDTLIKIARRTGTTVSGLIRLNNIQNPDLIVPGSVLRLPSGEDAPASNIPPETAVDQAKRGIEIFPTANNIDTLIARVNFLGIKWVKITVHWEEIEAIPGILNFSNLDPIIRRLRDEGFDILLTLTAAPDWARPGASLNMLVENGPPDDFADFGIFAAALASRYAGKVDAYEIWSEPNLRREWNSSIHSIRADRYVALLAEAYRKIKVVDPSALIITAGLAPTGFNDGVNAIDDRVYLQDMIANNVADFSDAIGAHPDGFANPPQLSCCEQPPGVDSHFGDPHFYFLDTLREYRDILDRNRLTADIWITRFGWGSADGNTIAAPGADSPYLNFTDQEEQGIYNSVAFEIGAELDSVAMMFLYNLNGCEVNDVEACFHSLFDITGMARPAALALEPNQVPVVAEGN